MFTILVLIITAAIVTGLVVIVKKNEVSGKNRMTSNILIVATLLVAWVGLAIAF